MPEPYAERTVGDAKRTRPAWYRMKTSRKNATKSQKKALRDLYPKWGLRLSYEEDVDAASLARLFGREAPTVLDIGFGTGSALIETARANPGTNYLGLDWHTPGVGQVLNTIESSGVQNVRVMAKDAVQLLKKNVKVSRGNRRVFSGVNIFFPDPWARQQQQSDLRLIRPEVAQLLAAAVAPGGFLHLATDVVDYVEPSLLLLRQSGWTGDVLSERPSWRPLTQYEQKGLDAGRPIADLIRVIRGWRLAGLEKRRVDFGGVRAGVDYVATNAYGLKASTTLTAARDVAEVVAGSVMTESHAAKLWGGDGLCRRCVEPTEETLGHIWWQCRAYERIRAQHQYAEIVGADRSTWPPCLQEHGILPKGSRVSIEVLHTFMAEVMHERRRLEREGRDRAVGHPWRQLHPDDCPPRRLNFEAIAGPGTFAAVGGERWFRALQHWLDGMCWSVAGDVSTAELAIDFEVYTGLDLPGSVVATTDGTPLSMRARVLARLLKTVGDALERNGDEPPLPGRKLGTVGSLRTVGAPPCLTGYEMRPIFRGGTETMEVLETQLTTARHEFNGEAWGMDLFPTYGGGRAERAARWAVFNDATEKKKGKKSAVVGGDPWYVPEGVPQHEKWGERVCHEHQKVKCDVCKRRGKSVAWCCKAHHKEDDGLAVKFCAQHRLTQCATCKTIAECCRNGHHRCLDHGMPTCAHCSRLADLRSRRPKLCCRKGHHRATVARGEEAASKKRKAELEGAAPAPRQAKRENVVFILQEAAEGKREPATSTPTSAAKVGKTAPTPAKKRQSDSAAEPVPKRRKGRVDAPRPSPRRREKAEVDAQPMNLDEQSKKKRSTKRAPERDDQDELKRRNHDTSRAKR
ncbi:tRNA (guanine-N(7)-)-methyltransferase [Diplonema papillatum]|nr:tRNA (guanine-N(7)-)-methyltransferase [Diplonema papillatum]